jgi:hypothetical protein
MWAILPGSGEAGNDNANVASFGKAPKGGHRRSSAPATLAKLSVERMVSRGEAPRLS